MSFANFSPFRSLIYVVGSHGINQQEMDLGQGTCDLLDISLDDFESDLTVNQPTKRREGVPSVNTHLGLDALPVFENGQLGGWIGWPAAVGPSPSRRSAWSFEHLGLMLAAS